MLDNTKCAECESARLSVMDEAAAVVVEHGSDSQVGRVVKRLAAFVTMYAEMQTVHDQEDFLKRLPWDTEDPSHSVAQMYEELRATYMVMTSRCTHEFGEDKCQK